MNREHDTIERHPACQGEEFLEFPLLLSSRHLAALKTAAFRQGVTVGRLLRRLIRDYLAAPRNVSSACCVLWDKSNKSQQDRALSPRVPAGLRQDRFRARGGSARHRRSCPLATA